MSAIDFRPAGDSSVRATQQETLAAKLSLESAAYSKEQALSRVPASKDQTAGGFLDVPILVASNDTRGLSSKHSQSLAQAASDLAGQQLWKQSKYKDLTVDGKYGCAASESLALNRAGYRYADSPTVGGLDGQLRRHGWKQYPADQAQPGDVMVAYSGKGWRNGGGNAHIGVVGNDGSIWNNSKRKGATWAKEPADVAFGDYEQRYVLRPPGK
jgi:hypothetical protein